MTDRRRRRDDDEHDRAGGEHEAEKTGDSARIYLRPIGAAPQGAGVRAEAACQAGALS